MRSHAGGLVFLGGVFLLIALWLAFDGAVELNRGLASAGWPETEGRIVRSALAEHPDGSSVEIAYEYSVQGKRYSGERIAFGQAWTEAVKEATVERYRQGGAVPVRYDPSDPQEAVLEPGFRWGVHMSVLGAAAFGGFGAYALYLGLRRARPTVERSLHDAGGRSGERPGTQSGPGGAGRKRPGTEELGREREKSEDA